MKPSHVCLENKLVEKFARALQNVLTTKQKWRQGRDRANRVNAS